MGKRVAVLVATLAAVLNLCACSLLIGKAGAPGEINLAVWVNYSEAQAIAAISTEALPGTFSYGFVDGAGTYLTDNDYYPLAEGSYGYQYQLKYDDASSVTHYSGVVSGTLSVSANPGEPGGLFTDGANGALKNYDWVLGWNSSRLDATVPALSLDNLQPAAVLNGGALDLTGLVARDHRSSSRTVGRYQVTIDETLYLPEMSTPSAPKR